MRVLAVTPLYPPRSRVGAWITTHEYLRAMVARGHVVTVLQGMAPANVPAYEHDGITVRAMARDRIRWFEDADVVVSHLGDNLVAARLAARRGIPSVRMVHSHQADPVHWPDDTALVVFNSEHLAAQVAWPGAWIVAPPPVHAADYATTPGACVTLVNLAEAKGGRLFWTLARRMPDTHFLGVRGGYGMQVRGAAPNVTLVADTPDMRDVYRRTRILLVPSSVESWGRVAIEAAASGIPTIAHPTPGLLESIGPTGIFVDRDDPAAWEATIRRLHVPAIWSDASRLASARFAELDPGGTIDRVCDAIENVAMRAFA